MDLINITILLFGALFLLILIGVPVAFSVGISSLITLIFALPDISLTVVAQRMFAGINSFSLLCIPFFIISGEFMSRGNISDRLINLANVIVGRIPGGLGHINVLTSMMFGGVSGSAQADVASEGPIIIPTMVDAGYSREFSVAITATSATIGMIIPPSNAMIIYCCIATTVSVSSMFIAGIIPGIMVGLAQMIVCYIMAKKHGYGKAPKTTAKEKLVAVVKGIPVLLLFAIIMGGILGGVVTATESAILAALYSAFLTLIVYRTVKLKDVPAMLYRSAVLSAAALFLIATSNIFGYLLAYANIPQVIASAMLSITNNQFLLMMMIVLLLLIVGTFMDMTPALIIFVPILLPIAQQFGIDPIQFGMIIIITLCIGLFTPPVGAALFLACNIGKCSLEGASKAMIPFMLAMIVVVMLVILVPELTCWLPSVVG